MPETVLELIAVCAYCRVSTHQESQLNSLENQTYYFEQKTEQNPKYDLFKIYADEGLTATSWKKRKLFKDMLYDAGLDIEVHRKEIKAYVSNRPPKFKRILVKDVSRFSRNASEGLEIVSKLREKGVHIDFVSLGLSTEQMTNDMIIGFFLLAAENESKDRSTKVMWGKKISAEKGRINTADKFFGYNYIKESNSLEIVEHEAETIRLIFDLYVNKKYGFRRIVNFLDEHEIRTRLGKPFVHQSIKRMLENPAYTGVLVRNKMDSPLVFTSKTYATFKPKDQWIITENRIPKIIDPEVYENAQSIKESKINYKNNVGLYTGLSEYAGLLVCGSCNNNYVSNVEIRTGKRYYNCKLKKRKGKRFCTNPNVFVNQIEGTIEHLSSGGLYDAVIKDKNTHIKSLNNKIDELLRKLNKQDIGETQKLTELRDELYEENKRLGILFLKKSIKEEDLNILQDELNDKIRLIEEEIEEKSMDNGKIYKKVDDLKSIISRLAGLEVKGKYTEKEVRDQIKNIVVNKSEEGRPVLWIKFNIFDEIEEIIGEM